MILRRLGGLVFIKFRISKQDGKVCEWVDMYQHWRYIGVSSAKRTRIRPQLQSEGRTDPHMCECMHVWNEFCGSDGVLSNFDCSSIPLSTLTQNWLVGQLMANALVWEISDESSESKQEFSTFLIATKPWKRRSLNSEIVLSDSMASRIGTNSSTENGPRYLFQGILVSQRACLRPAEKGLGHFSSLRASLR
jgi:hypothetical protein